MRLVKWAEKHEVTYRTAWNYFKSGKLYGAYKLPGGAIIVPEIKQEYIVTYARVDTEEEIEDLKKQNEKLVKFCDAKGWRIDDNVREIGFKNDDNREKLIEILESKKITKLVVEDIATLADSGLSYIVILLDHIGCDLVVINQDVI